MTKWGRTTSARPPRHPMERRRRRDTSVTEEATVGVVPLTGYKLPEGRTMSDVLRVQDELIRGELELPPVNRARKCTTCSGDLVEHQDPKPGVERAVMCSACGKWVWWALKPGPST